MKKIFFFLALSFFIVPVFAQEQQPTETTDIKEIKARYCNDPEKIEQKSLFIDAKVDEKSVICIDFINTSSKKASIGINFVDATITNDDSQNKACLPESEKTNFGQYVSNYPESLEIAGNSVKRVFVDLLYSGGFAGSSYGCLTYHSLDNIDKNEDLGGNMLHIFSRVGSFIDSFVQGEFKILLVSSPIETELYKNLGDNPNLFIYRESSDWSKVLNKDFWTYKMRRNVTNTGNIGITGQVELSIKNWYLFNSTQYLNDQVFIPSQTRTFESSIPWYKVWFMGGPLKVTGTIDYNAIYLGTFADEAPEETFTMTDNSSHIFFPWILVFVLLYLFMKVARKYYKKETFLTENRARNVKTRHPSEKKVTTSKRIVKSTTAIKTNVNSSKNIPTSTSQKKVTTTSRPRASTAKPKKINSVSSIPKPKKPNSL